MDEGPRPMKNLRATKKIRNCVDQFWEAHQAEYEARGQVSKDAMKQVHQHNLASPRLNDELDKRKSLSKLTTNLQRNGQMNSKRPVCAACTKLLRLNQLQKMYKSKYKQRKEKNKTRSRDIKSKIRKSTHRVKKRFKIRSPATISANKMKKCRCYYVPVKHKKVGNDWSTILIVEPKKSVKSDNMLNEGISSSLSTQNIQSKKRMNSSERIQNVQSKKRMNSSERIQNVQSKKRMKSIESLQNVQSKERMKSIESFQNVQSKERKISSERIQNVQPKKRMNSSENIQNFQSKERMKSIESLQNVQSKERMKSIESFQNVQSKERMKSIERIQNVQSKERMNSSEKIQNFQSKERMKFNERTGIKLPNERMNNKKCEKKDSRQSSINTLRHPDTSVASMSSYNSYASLDHEPMVNMEL